MEEMQIRGMGEPQKAQPAQLRHSTATKFA